MSELVRAARERAQTDSPTHELLRQMADEIERLEIVVLHAAAAQNPDNRLLQRAAELVPLRSDADRG